MKLKVTEKSYEEVLALPKQKHKKPKNPNMLFRTLLKIVSLPDLLKTHFKCEKIGMEKLKKGENALFLMNHSSFIDLEIVVSLLYPRSFNIVTNREAFIGMNWLMRQIGCIPANKFISDHKLVRDIMHAVRKNKSSIVLFPEASYTFDGTATPLPDTTGALVKMLGLPVVMIQTYGAFHRDPLYNNLQVRKVDVSATQTYLLSSEEIAQMSVDEINAVLTKTFDFDNFGWQRENKIKVDEPFRADYLNRVLYKCPKCKKEGKMVGKGVKLTCPDCGAEYILDEYGYLRCENGRTEFDHAPTWYQWQRECVREELLKGQYLLETDVTIYMTVDSKHLYHIGEGHLRHDDNGFVLDGCDGKLHYEHKPLASYSLYSDFFWYEIGDIISIGRNDEMYFCVPKTERDVVAKARLAAEELYKIKMAEKEQR